MNLNWLSLEKTNLNNPEFQDFLPASLRIISLKDVPCIKLTSSLLRLTHLEVIHLHWCEYTIPKNYNGCLINRKKFASDTQSKLCIETVLEQISYNQGLTFGQFICYFSNPQYSSVSRMPNAVSKKMFYLRGAVDSILYEFKAYRYCSPSGQGRCVYWQEYIRGRQGTALYSPSNQTSP